MFAMTTSSSGTFAGAGRGLVLAPNSGQVQVDRHFGEIDLSPPVRTVHLAGPPSFRPCGRDMLQASRDDTQARPKARQASTSSKCAAGRTPPAMSGGVRVRERVLNCQGAA